MSLASKKHRGRVTAMFFCPAHPFAKSLSKRFGQL